MFIAFFIGSHYFCFIAYRRVPLEHPSQLSLQERSRPHNSGHSIEQRPSLRQKSLAPDTPPITIGADKPPPVPDKTTGTSTSSTTKQTASNTKNNLQHSGSTCIKSSKTGSIKTKKISAPMVIKQARLQEDLEDNPPTPPAKSPPAAKIGLDPVSASADQSVTSKLARQRSWRTSNPFSPTASVAGGGAEVDSEVVDTGASGLCIGDEGVMKTIDDTTHAAAPERTSKTLSPITERFI